VPSIQDGPIRPLAELTDAAVADPLPPSGSALVDGGLGVDTGAMVPEHRARGTTMQTKYKVIAGSLGGAAAIHMAFVACGQGLHTGGQPGDAGIFDALIDQISGLMDGTTKDAKADDSGACGCAVAGPIQSVPASENPAQLKFGNLGGLSGSTGSIVVNGPFVLTDATTGQVGGGQSCALVVEPSAGACAAFSSGDPGTLPGYVMTTSTSPPGVHGGRYVVPAGQMLCAYPGDPALGNIGNVQWAGFVPYQ
jgi:hypothetical protein